MYIATKYYSLCEAVTCRLNSTFEGIRYAHPTLEGTVCGHEKVTIKINFFFSKCSKNLYKNLYDQQLIFFYNLKTHTLLTKSSLIGKTKSSLKLLFRTFFVVQIINLNF